MQLVVVHVTEVAAVVPKLTLELAATKPVPVMVTTVPPPAGPTLGEIAATTGAMS